MGDQTWVKRKTLITLDLVLLRGVLAVTTRERAGSFGSHVIGARRDDGSFDDVGDVASLDVERDRVIQGEFVREGLIRDNDVKRLSLRDPKIVQLRSDKGADEADTSKMTEALSVRERFE